MNSFLQRPQQIIFIISRKKISKKNQFHSDSDEPNRLDLVRALSATFRDHNTKTTPQTKTHGHEQTTCPTAESTSCFGSTNKQHDALKYKKSQSVLVKQSSMDKTRYDCRPTTWLSAPSIKQTQHYQRSAHSCLSTTDYWSHESTCPNPQLAVRLLWVSSVYKMSSYGQV